MTCFSIPAFILAEKLSGVTIGTPLVRVAMATEGAPPGLRAFAPVDAAGGETAHMTQAQR